jgi:hypothetical protein
MSLEALSVVVVQMAPDLYSQIVIQMVLLLVRNRTSSIAKLSVLPVILRSALLELSLHCLMFNRGDQMICILHHPLV